MTTAVTGLPRRRPFARWMEASLAAPDPTRASLGRSPCPAYGACPKVRKNLTWVPKVPTANLQAPETRYRTFEAFQAPFTQLINDQIGGPNAESLLSESIAKAQASPLSALAQTVKWSRRMLIQVGRHMPKEQYGR